MAPSPKAENILGAGLLTRAPEPMPPRPQEQALVGLQHTAGTENAGYVFSRSRSLASVKAQVLLDISVRACVPWRWRGRQDQSRSASSPLTGHLQWTEKAANNGALSHPPLLKKCLPALSPPSFAYELHLGLAKLLCLREKEQALCIMPGGRTTVVSGPRVGSPV